MVHLINEDFKQNGIFIVFAQKMLKLQDISAQTGKKFIDWNQLVRYCVQQLRSNKWVQVVDVKTLESTWLQPTKLDDYTQSGGILSKDDSGV